ncbi:serine hydrolase, partial [Escherichia coli]|nr:serine hydrolase [Escherichia coli]
MMKSKKNLLLAASLATAALLSCSATAAESAPCGGVPLSVCPTPFDRALPDPKTMLSWDQQDRVVGFRNDYRNYPADVFHHHGTAQPLPLAKHQLGEVSYRVNGHRYS